MWIIWIFFIFSLDNFCFNGMYGNRVVLALFGARIGVDCLFLTKSKWSIWQIIEKFSASNKRKGCKTYVRNVYYTVYIYNTVSYVFYRIGSSSNMQYLAVFTNKIRSTVWIYLRCKRAIWWLIRCCRLLKWTSINKCNMLGFQIKISCCLLSFATFKRSR